ncbi:hypothetical protein [Roseibium sp. FZY0029]|uniref:hypothetical protein n=1 Tax=Roseibium sp. FZY0029 TaxID=3116647 RepID=UPI002ED55B9B
MMANARQQQLLLDLFESLPSIVFILLWRQTSNLELAGWTGCGFAAFVLAGLVLLKARIHPVLIGINLHILLVTPVLVGFYRFGDRALAEFLTDTLTAPCC